MAIGLRREQVPETPAKPASRKREKSKMMPPAALSESLTPRKALPQVPMSPLASACPPKPSEMVCETAPAARMATIAFWQA